MAALNLPDKILWCIPNYSAADADPSNVKNHYCFQLLLSHTFEDETAVRNPLQTWQNVCELYVSSVNCALDTHLGDVRSVIAPKHDERLARLEWDGIARLLNPAGASLGARRLRRFGPARQKPWCHD